MQLQCFLDQGPRSRGSVIEHANNLVHRRELGVGMQRTHVLADPIFYILQSDSQLANHPTIRMILEAERHDLEQNSEH